MKIFRKCSTHRDRDSERREEENENFLIFRSDTRRRVRYGKRSRIRTRTLHTLVHSLISSSLCNLHLINVKWKILISEQAKERELKRACAYTPSTRFLRPMWTMASFLRFLVLSLCAYGRNYTRRFWNIDFPRRCSSRCLVGSFSSLCRCCSFVKIYFPRPVSGSLRSSLCVSAWCLIFLSLTPPLALCMSFATFSSSDTCFSLNSLFFSSSN